jgi:hypothetical protein
MIIEVEMNAFQNGKIRPVEVPSDAIHMDTNELLNIVFHNGQNDFQPVEGCCSVSVDDVIRIGDERWKVSFMGFELLPDEHEDYELDDIGDTQAEINEGGF